jgi:hypothetical protein
MTWGVIISIIVLSLFYPHVMWLVLRLSIGILAWSASLFMESWWQLFYFLAAASLIVLIMWGWCAHLAVASIQYRIADTDANPRWRDLCLGRAMIFRQTGSVVGAILLELLLPVFLLLALMTLVEAVIQLLGITNIWRDFTQKAIGALREAWTMSPEDLHQKLAIVLEPFKKLAPYQSLMEQGVKTGGEAVKEGVGTGETVVKEGIGLITGTIGAGTSLLLFLLRRRRTHLTAARVIAEEIASVVTSAFNAVPHTLAQQVELVNIPKDLLLIGTSSERELLLLHPSTEHPTKLPVCLLPAAVAFFHADLALNQSYNGITGLAFAQADERRRTTYFGYLKEEWENYQTTAFRTLLRLAFYRRLRKWTI